VFRQIKVNEADNLGTSLVCPKPSERFPDLNQLAHDRHTGVDF
jgi:hypothetical protein